MNRGILEFFKRTLIGEAPIHPVDKRMAKDWIKRRLVAVFPQLRWDPVALEAAYQELTLEVQIIPGEDGQNERQFNLRYPGEVEQ